ncbi:MAG: M20/M25/M40 family metallo-hydrolase [Caulobacteraceae bacterium]
MSVRLDPLGNLLGRYEGIEANAPALLIGSHIDTVRNGGRYDGALGVMLGIEAVEALSSAGRRMPFAIEVIAFGDEEGSRFPGLHAVQPRHRRRHRRGGAGARGRRWRVAAPGLAGLRPRPHRHRQGGPQAGRGVRLCRGPYRTRPGPGGPRSGHWRGHRHRRPAAAEGPLHRPGRPCRHQPHGSAQGRHRRCRRRGPGGRGNLPGRGPRPAWNRRPLPAQDRRLQRHRRRGRDGHRPARLHRRGARRRRRGHQDPPGRDRAAARRDAGVHRGPEPARHPPATSAWCG